MGLKNPARQYIFEANDWGNALHKSGSALTGEGLKGLRSLDVDFSKILKEGGLTEDLRRQFDVAGGRLTDQYVRSGRTLRAALEQRRLQSQGALTPGAIAEYEKEGSAEAGEQYFEASNQLANEKAMLSYTASTDLMDRITNIRDTIRETGMSQEQQAMLAKLQAAMLKLQQKRDTVNALTGLLSFGLGK